MRLRASPCLALGAAVLGLLAPVVVLSGCSDEAGPPAAPEKRAPPREGVPGIVLLCMDTLRADAVATGPGGEDARRRMPALDAFARTATVFADASASSSWTAPSVATLLTGLEPAHTGVRGAFSAGALVFSVTTLAEALKERGFSTAAYTAGGWVAPERGYAQGFGSYSVAFDESGPEAVLADWQASRPKDAPFFLFLHTIAPHDPYGPKVRAWGPEDLIPEIHQHAKALYRETVAAGWELPKGAAAWFFERFLFNSRERWTAGEAFGAEGADRMWNLCMDWLDGEGRGTPDLERLIPRAKVAYREGLSYADSVFARTLAALDAAHLPEGTVVAVVGDHGEELGEHGTLLHARWLYDELARVPLIVRAPGRFPAGSVVRGSCGLVDVLPTLLALAGVREPEGLDGRSLLPLVRGEERGHPVFAEEERRPPGESVRRILRIASVRTEAAKLLVTYDIHTLAVERTELYDLAADPGETSPLPLTGLSHFGDAFCRAAAHLSKTIPGLPSEEGSCGPAMK